MREGLGRETGLELTPDRWLDTAVKGIRFAPDRRAVRAELAGHLEDRAADLRRIFPDLTDEEAQERTLAGMGDAAEIGKQLARVHRPWLGYLWRASRWASVAAAVLLALTLLTTGLPDQWRSWQWTREENQRGRAISQALYEDGTPSWEGERLALYAPEAEGRLGRCTVSVDRAALWREPDGDQLYLELRLTFDRPWERGERPLYQMRAEDERGEPLSRENGWTSRGWETGFNWIAANWVLPVEGEPPDRLTVRYFPGVDWELTVDLTREVRA